MKDEGNEGMKDEGNEGRKEGRMKGMKEGRKILPCCKNFVEVQLL